MFALADFTDDVLAALGLPPVDVNEAAAVAARTARASTAALAHLPEHRTLVGPFGAERAEPAPQHLPAAAGRLQPCVQYTTGDERRLERRRALRQIAAAGDTGVSPQGYSPDALLVLVSAGLITVDQRLARITPAGRQAATAA